MANTELAQQGSRTYEVVTFPHFVPNIPSPADAIVAKLNRLDLPIVRASELPTQEKTPSGIADLDQFLLGGFPTGISVLTGSEQSGKSLIAAHVAAHTVKQEKRVLYLSDEPVPGWLSHMSTILPDTILLLNALPSLDETTTVMRELLTCNMFGAVVIDSFSTLIPTLPSLEERDALLIPLRAVETARFVKRLHAMSKHIPIILTAQTRFQQRNSEWKEDMLGGTTLRGLAKLILKLSNLSGEKPSKNQEGQKGLKINITPVKTKITLHRNGKRPCFIPFFP